MLTMPTVPTIPTARESARDAVQEARSLIKNLVGAPTAGEVLGCRRELSDWAWKKAMCGDALFVAARALRDEGVLSAGDAAYLFRQSFKWTVENRTRDRLASPPHGTYANQVSFALVWRPLSSTSSSRAASSTYSIKSLCGPCSASSNGRCLTMRRLMPTRYPIRPIDGSKSAPDGRPRRGSCCRTRTVECRTGCRPSRRAGSSDSESRSWRLCWSSGRPFITTGCWHQSCAPSCRPGRRVDDDSSQLLDRAPVFLHTVLASRRETVAIAS